MKDIFPKIENEWYYTKIFLLHHDPSRPGVKERHDKKKNLCKKNNTLLIIIWEDQWNNNKDSCKQSLRDLIEKHSA